MSDRICIEFDWIGCEHDSFLGKEPTMTDEKMQNTASSTIPGAFMHLGVAESPITSHPLKLKAESWPFTFGPYVVFPAEKVLLLGGQQLKLGSRAFDLLLALAQHPGKVMSQVDLMAIVWPRTIVEESSLRVQLGLLRKALGDGKHGARYIATLSGRGYCFVAPIAIKNEPEATREQIFAPRGTCLSGMTAARTPLHLVGRDRELARISAAAPRRSLVTLTGPSGIGKSALAQAAARHLAPLFREGYRFVDLAQMVDGDHVKAAVAAAISSSVTATDTSGSGPSLIDQRQLLLILDNCDLHLGCVSALTRELQTTRPDIHVLATSRRPLCVEDEEEEALLHLRPLAFPPAAATFSAGEALAFPAVQLFVQEAVTHLESFKLDDANARLVVEVCKKLEGLPLAIKLAAAWVEHLALDVLVSLFDAHLLHRLGLDEHASFPLSNGDDDWSGVLSTGWNSPGLTARH